MNDHEPRYKIISAEEATADGYLGAAHYYDATAAYWRGDEYELLVDTLLHAVVADDDYADRAEDATFRRGLAPLVNELNRLADLVNLRPR